jgi:pyrroloquinoline-quinone synthase
LTTATNLTELDRIVAANRLLDHPFYQAWNQGKLSIEELQDYAGQYYAFEATFPRFLSSIHSRCEDQTVRQALLSNLWDEEYGPDNHLALWLRFAEGLGLEADAVRNSEVRPSTQALIDTYSDICSNGSVAEGIAALYAYESQASEVARQKIIGLKTFYDIEDERTISFFSVHVGADEGHSAAEGALLEALVTTEDEWAGVREATVAARDALCGFLSGIPIRYSC